MQMQEIFRAFLSPVTHVRYKVADDVSFREKIKGILVRRKQFSSRIRSPDYEEPISPDRVDKENGIVHFKSLLYRSGYPPLPIEKLDEAFPGQRLPEDRTARFFIFGIPKLRPSIILWLFSALKQFCPAIHSLGIRFESDYYKKNKNVSVLRASFEAVLPGDSVDLKVSLPAQWQLQGGFWFLDQNHDLSGSLIMSLQKVEDQNRPEGIVTLEKGMRQFIEPLADNTNVIRVRKKSATKEEPKPGKNELEFLQLGKKKLDDSVAQDLKIGPDGELIED